LERKVREREEEEEELLRFKRVVVGSDDRPDHHPSSNKETKRYFVRNVTLIIDSREKRMNKDRDYFVKTLSNLGVNCENQTIRLGDMLWTATTDEGEVFVLDYIIERKNLDDLCHSFMDGRYTGNSLHISLYLICCCCCCCCYCCCYLLL